MAVKKKTEGGKYKGQLSDWHIAEIAKTLDSKFRREERDRYYAPVRDVLSIIGKTLLIGVACLVPNSARAMKRLAKHEYEDWNDWKYFNPSYLKKTIQNLEKQKDVRIKKDEDGLLAVELTDKGRRKILKYALDELEIKEPRLWDGKWRLVLYDIPVKYKDTQSDFRSALTRLGFYRFQESVYIYPFKCKDEVEYIRSFMGIREYVRVITVNKLENDQAFRTYFGLD